MNFLFAYSVGELSKIDSSLPIIYGTLSSAKVGLSHFKWNVGCQQMSLLISGTPKEFKALHDFSKRYSLHGDSALNFVLEYVIRDKTHA